MICPYCGSQKVYAVKEIMDFGHMEHLIGYDCDGCGAAFDTDKHPALKEAIEPGDLSD